MAKFERGDHVELAQACLQRIAQVSDGVVGDEGRLYRFIPDIKLWGEVTEDDLSRIVYKFAGRPVVAHRFQPLCLRDQDVKGVINVAKNVAGKPGYFAKAPIGLAFSNGFVKVSAEEVRRVKLTKEHRCRSGFNFPYDPEARSPEFEAFVRGLFRDDPDGEDKVNFIQEIFGASLARIAPKFQKCALLIGDGSNGKDTLIEVLRDVFPKDTVSAIPPHRWGGEYARASLAGKWLNIVGELPEVELAASEAFKAIVAGSSVDARFPYGKFFDVVPEAGHIFALNNSMATPDFSHGFFRRFGIVKFNRVFTEAEADRNIPEKMQAHRPAIAAWLLEGARRLLQRGAYVLPASHRRELVEWRLEADQVAMYLDTCTKQVGADEAWTRADTLFQDYAAWARSNEHRPVSSTKFGRRVKMVLKEAKVSPDSKRTSKGMYYPLRVGGGTSGVGWLATRHMGQELRLIGGKTGGV